MKPNTPVYLHLLLGNLLFLACCIGCQPKVPERKVTHAILIGLDAFGSRGFQKAETPYMNQLVAEGAIAPFARAVLPTNSSPNWTSMLTGADPLQHGVYDNAWELDKQRWPPVLTTASGRYPSLFNWMHEQLPDANMQLFYEWGGLAHLYDLDAAKRVYKGSSGDDVFSKAVQAFFEEKPDFLFIDIDEIDHFGHQDGHDSRAYFNSISHYDSLIGDFVQKLEDAGIMDETLILITGDHGGIGKGHGGTSLDELEIPIILYGKGIQPGRVIDKPCYQYDVAPTLAYALGITPPKAGVGRPIVEAFDPSVPADSFAPMPLIFPTGGFFKQDTLLLEVKSDAPHAEIRYTLDGTVPTATTGTVYQEPIHLKRSELVTAISVVNGEESRPEIQQYRLTTKPGRVNWEYLEGTFSRVPDFQGLVIQASGKSSEISLEEIPHREDHFAVRYTATLVVPTEGQYTFYLQSDDGSLLYVNGELLIDNDGSHSAAEKSNTLELVAGKQELEVRYFEDIAGETLQLFISGPGIPRQLVSADFFE